MNDLASVIEQREVPKGAGFEVTVVIPTLNEVGNIRLLVEKLGKALEGVAWEALFVDDNSKDGSYELFVELARTMPNVRFIRRVGRRGLSSACIEGMMACASPYIAVMDADLQHDETRLPLMLDALRTGQYDLAIGSRFAEGSSLGEFSESRTRLSERGIGLSQKLFGVKVSDPLTGFFMLRREVLDDTVARLSGRGFKILLDLLVTAGPNLRVKEIPFNFGTRHAGESKLGAFVMADFGLLIYDKLLAGLIPTKLFLSYLFVGFYSLVSTLAYLAIAPVVVFMPALWAHLAAAATLFFIIVAVFAKGKKRPLGLKLRLFAIFLGEMLPGLAVSTALVSYLEPSGFWLTWALFFAGCVFLIPALEWYRNRVYRG